jgi:serine/threonine protein kinase
MDDGEKYECFAFTPVGVAFSSGALVDKPAEARQLFREVLVTLKEAHQYVFHRDVKPQNLLRVDAEGKATVVTNDWGLAIPVDDALPGDRCGTLRYSSPALSSSAHSYGVEDDFAGLVLTVVDLVRPDWISWSAGQDDTAQQKRQLFAASHLDSLLDDDAWRDLVVGLRAHFREDAIVWSSSGGVFGKLLSPSAAHTIIRAVPQDVITATKQYPSKSSSDVDLIEHEHGQSSVSAGGVIVINGHSAEAGDFFRPVDVELGADQYLRVNEVSACQRRKKSNLSQSQFDIVREKDLVISLCLW